MTRLVVRRRRWAGATTPVEQARAAWADLQDTLVDHGYTWRPSDSPRKGIARLVAEQRPQRRGGRGRRPGWPTSTERTRYAPVTPESVGRRARRRRHRPGGHGRDRPAGGAGWRARLLPRSTRAVATALSERLADALDAVDNAVAAVTTRLRLRRT